jgi:7-cyano-7-deazaguanine reductase
LIAGDLTAIAGSPVEVALVTDRSTTRLSDMPGQCIDDLEMPASAATVDASLLVSGAGDIVEASLHSHLLRSLCPVTGQPDYASVLVRYRGPRIDPATLLSYIVSYRTHQDFHEACVERMFCDIRRSCDTEHLTVYARYTRRGGIDINPFRSDFEDNPEHMRLWRQ